jgi:hypothetical protein
LAKPRAQQILAMCLHFSGAFIMSYVTSVQADELFYNGVAPGDVDLHFSII